VRTHIVSADEPMPAAMKAGKFATKFDRFRGSPTQQGVRLAAMLKAGASLVVADLILTEVLQGATLTLIRW